MSEISALASEHLDIWTTATERRSGAGRGGGKRISFYGIQRLRALILDLAVRGQLVPQVASDEPASELMKRVGQIKDAQEGRGNKAAGAIPPMDVPAGWIAVRLADLANPQAGFAFKSVGFNELGVGLPLIRIRDVGQPFTGTFYSGDYRDDFVVHEGDYLISMDGEFRVATWDGPDALLNQRVSRLQFYGDEVVRPFVALALQTELTQLQGVKAYTTVDHLSGKQIAGSVIRLPSIAEQRRIMAKVDELMALCDALEGESATALAAHQTLVETLLATLVKSADAANWTRLEAHFDALFTTPASVEALERTILELAVRGRLVANSGNAWPTRKLEDLIGPMDSGWSPACMETPAPNEEAWGVLKTTAVQRLTYDEAQNKELPADLTPRPAAECKAGDILFTRAGPMNRVGICCYVEATRPRLMISDKIIRFRPVSDEVNGAFLALALSVGPAAKQIEEAKSGMATSQVNVSQAKLRGVTIALPSPEVQRATVERVGTLMSLCDLLKAQIEDAALTQMRLADAITERAAA
ncbi:restriction endonuclease subunit S [Caulobacter sp. BK020]|uniref:restriction endonuclease subunit S n=1 Tax=Caulobacter sp. BK020 TaxID=2512117 RepID=UPI00104E3ABA|nr:restriction endonuclease subunit S [Caulobacter sp. BK020]TCS02865.1 type I restriction enzyme S subunit [Caulobacter sp. BK020]